MIRHTDGHEYMTRKTFHGERGSFWYSGAMNQRSNLKDEIEKKVGEPDGTLQDDFSS